MDGGPRDWGDAAVPGMGNPDALGSHGELEVDHGDGEDEEVGGHGACLAVRSGGVDDRLADRTRVGVLVEDIVRVDADDILCRLRRRDGVGALCSSSS